MFLTEQKYRGCRGVDHEFRLYQPWLLQVCPESGNNYFSLLSLDTILGFDEFLLVLTNIAKYLSPEASRGGGGPGEVTTGHAHAG